MNWRIKLYRWFRFKLLRQDPACFPTGVAKPMAAILFPIEWLYNEQARIRYIYETDTYLIRGAAIRGKVFDFVAGGGSQSVVLVKDEFGKWEIDKQ